jgi:hypothetical protein
MSKQHTPQEQDTATLPTQPGHVMAREHYERLAREAAQQQK